jgi:hypothetical protein
LRFVAFDGWLLDRVAALSRFSDSASQYPHPSSKEIDVYGMRILVLINSTRNISPT